MSIVQGYTSSEEESDASNQHVIVEPPPKKLKTFAGSFQNLPIDDSTFENSRHDESRKISKEAKKLAKQLKNKRYKNGKSTDPWSHNSTDDEQQPVPEPVNEPEPTEPVDTDPTFEPSSEYVGSQEFDYQGRTYMTVPKHLTDPQPPSTERFVPKKVIHTFPGHAKGVNRLQFFPNSGHLLLSCGNDNLIKLWSITPSNPASAPYELLRVFRGHELAVRDVKFNGTGDKFLSCGYDKRVHLWDTQSGRVLRTVVVDAMPNVVLFNPNNEDEFVVGLTNSKIVHFKMSGISYRTPIQTYDHHQGGIIDLVNLASHEEGSGALFISSSEDKTVRFWKWQVNIPEKVITDPSQHSLPSIKPHPSANYIAAQSMDNSVKVVHSYGKFKWYKKKVFRGHNVAGYGIEIGFSPDGKILMSGDSKGYAYFWDWKSCKLVKKLKVSEKVVKCIVFHPRESSKVAVAGASGEIYYCD
ncbi:Pre-mRNA-processing factor 17 [Candida viswanathii]|uniref:Pre-mRNA-processing factor 17 n=1 Tax=Candida viswanathii TaxID=5486 RepID=A0A367YEH9_9ASCO|nr:Pre-mRNA-processing factor 17 [Candida viswanathii]